MSAAALLKTLSAAGVHMSREGHELRFRTEPGTGISQHIETIRQYKPALIRELLQDQIVAAASVEPEHFDRDAYDRLWSEWHELSDQEINS